MQKGSISEKLRRVPFAYPEESLLRAAELMREGGVGALPIVAGGVVIGCLTEQQLRKALVNDRNGFQAVSEWMETECALIPLESPLEAAVDRLQQTDQPLLIVTDSEGRYVGVLSAADVLSRPRTPPRPSLLGGMATPMGVYLTTATVRAGAGDFALVLTGALLFALYLLSTWIVLSVTQWLQNWFGFPLYSSLLSPFAGTTTLPDVLGVFLRGMVIVVFLGLMRAIPLAGTHAAEHKVVHTIERGEPLVLEVVRRMPRVHPRCGTNLAAGVFLFLGLADLFRWFLPTPEGEQLGLLLALVLTVFCWRAFGSFLQWIATTKPPTDKQLRAAIRVGEELLSRHARVAYLEPSFGRRLWNSGLLQILIGVWLAVALVELLQSAFGVNLLLL